jgi:deferrochelatase/peroxidase EfeB
MRRRSRLTQPRDASQSRADGHDGDQPTPARVTGGADGQGPGVSRRGFLAGGGALGGALLAGSVPGLAGVSPTVGQAFAAGPPGGSGNEVEPFYGPHQGGVTTPVQDQTYLASFDLITERRSEVVDLLRRWSELSARLCAGETAVPLGNPHKVVMDTGEAIGLSPGRLTITFGFSPTLFSKEGEDRYGLASRRPAALVELPAFQGDEINAQESGGDITVQACSEDPQVAFHAIRQLARNADGVATLRWAQAGFQTASMTDGTPRNLLGFKDGTANPNVRDHKLMDRFIWVGKEGPGWMRGGSYMVFRRVRTTIERWDTLTTVQQENIIGRHKLSGAPLGEKSEFAPLDLTVRNGEGEPVIPEDAHVRLAAPQNNGGTRILRRVYNYNNGVNQFTERWPPWRQGLEYDIGLLFCAYQRDPHEGFIRIFKSLAINDALNQFSTHTASVIVAVPPGAPRPGTWVGQRLFT